MNIVYFSPIRWDFLKQRPQHLAEELSHIYNMYYIEPSVSVVHSLFYRNRDFLASEFNVKSNLSVIRPDGRYRLPKIFDLVDIFGLNVLYEKKGLKSVLQAADLIWISSPLYYSYVRDISKPVVYDKMDEYDKLTPNLLMRKLILKNESQLLKQADIIFTSSHKMYRDIYPINNEVKLIRNGLDHELCVSSSQKASATANKIMHIKSEGQKRIFGYVGSVDHWFDYEVVRIILKQSPQNCVVIVGHNNLPRMNHPNIIYFDPVPKAELGAVIQNFNYCLYPFVQNGWLDSIDPVKIYDYLSFNKKVIAVKSAETNRFSTVIQLYANYNELLDILNELSNASVPFTNEQLRLFINDNSWSKRANEMIQHLQKI